jgi:hypothetical protein
MKQLRSLSQKHVIAQQGGFMPTYWSATTVISIDRTPENAQGSEGGGYA